VDRTQRDAVVEQITQQFDNAAERTMTDQHQAEDQLSQPRLGHRQIEEHLIVSSLVRAEGFVQGLRGGGGLLVNKLATDLVIAGQLANGLCPSQGLDGQLLALVGGERVRATEANLLLRSGDAIDRLDAHVCFLLETGGCDENPPVWGKQTI